MSNKYKTILLLIFVLLISMPIYSQIGKKKNENNCIDSCKSVFSPFSCDVPFLNCRLQTAIGSNNVECVQKTIEEEGVHNPISKKFDVVKYPILYSILEGNEKIVKLILSFNPELEMKDKEYEMTPILWASFLIDRSNMDKNNYLNIAKTLIKSGSNVNAQDKNGRTALILNSTYGKTDFVKLFIEEDADLDLQTKNGKTALMLASDNPEIIITLLNASANTELKDIKGRTAVYYAIEKCQTNKLKLLINNGADIYLKDKEGLTPISFAKQVTSYKKCSQVFDLLEIKAVKPQ